MSPAQDGTTRTKSTTTLDTTSSAPEPTLAPATGFIELVPQSGRSVDPLDLIPNERREAEGTIPWVFANMVASLDGATAVEGVSGGLGGESDRKMFRALRSSADAIIAGSKTVIQEKYRPAKPNNQGNLPLIVVISGSLDLPISLPLFQNPSQRPLIATTSRASSLNRSSLADVADFADCGINEVNLDQLLLHLGKLGIRRALLEGGPRVNGQFIQDDLVDEWNLTLSPLLVAGPSSRPSISPLRTSTSTFELKRLLRSGETLFGRWVKAGANEHAPS